MKARVRRSATPLTAPTIRVRLTAWAVLISSLLALAVFVAALALIRQEEVANQRTALIYTGREVADAAQYGHLRGRLVPKEYVQVVDTNGRVVSTTRTMEGYPVVDFTPPDRPGTRRDGHSCRIQAPGGECFLVSAFRVGTGPSQRIIYTLAPEPGLIPRPELAALVALGIPVMGALMGFLTWQVVGNALRPVEAVRAELDEITATDLERRVPVPDGGSEVARLAESVNATLDRLETAVARLRGFVSDVSHELRSPLTGLRMELELALSDPLARDSRESLEAVLINAERLHAVLDDLLAIARLEASPELPRERVDLQALADQEVLRRPRRSRFTVTGGEPVIVHGGRSELGRLLTNLLDNADRHAAGAVTVSVRTEPGPVPVPGRPEREPAGREPAAPAGTPGAAEPAEPRTAVVEVYDDGPGVAPEDRERVFERFTRLAEARHSDAGGTGLGLAISRDIAEAHGGTLVLTDRADGRPGARLLLRLPAG
ncbi:sensor histidine kinase [Actinomadura viridis]|uniref:sensor histidine kinase n=1 Tax=Actinomadura viridis TaxID=58110 RepID=UPI0036AE9103